ncbi:hypothetical protein FACS1894156_2200 [Bacteroidia bacterium]|nr:hypothetical protein FACS1894156_2200 [Bacteroidia bacterium]
MNAPPFLQTVADDLFARYGEKISSLSFVFPSKRSQLYFCNYLSQLLQESQWQPTVVSLDDIFSQISGLQAAEHYHCIAVLYKVYKECYNSEESFDRFYTWGEMLLNDFDSIDKYLVAAEKLFVNLRHSKQLDADFSFLSDEQREMVQSFWKNFSAEKSTGLQENFENIWAALLPIYQKFGAQLQSQNAVYQGLMQRRAVEVLKQKNYDFGEQHFVFVGLNAVTECEKKLLHSLKDAGKADFYWDYDNYYVDNQRQEAGEFMRYNLQHFPSVNSSASTDNFGQHKDIQVVAAPSDALQTKLLPQMLDELRGNTPLSALRNTAIVLVDEGLLLPVLYAMPTQNDKNDSDGIAAFNVTMGYPLQQTPVYSLIEMIANLHKNARQENNLCKFYYKDVLAILQHPYLQTVYPQQMQQLQESIVKNNRLYVDTDFFAALPGEIKELWAPPASYSQLCTCLVQLLQRISMQDKTPAAADNDLTNEYIVCACSEIKKLHNALQNSGLEITPIMLMSLLCNALKSTKIPFEGDPITEVQIMGILETHTLDFDNLIVLSLNEDKLAYRNSNASFIPYNLRRAFGLPVLEQYDALYAYYFYRLLQRSQTVRLLYNSQTEGMRSGEISRYVRQMQQESPHTSLQTIRAVTYRVNTRQPFPIVVCKDDNVQQKLQEFADGQRAFSATALQKLMVCPLQFYFSAIACIKVPDEITEDVDGKTIGDIFHHTMEILYKNFVHQQVDEKMLRELLQQREALETLVLQQTASVYLKDIKEVEAVKKNGQLWLAGKVVQKYVENTLHYDIRRAPFTVQDTEHHFTTPIALHINNTEKKILFKGSIDRIDSSPQSTVIIDYKTGSMNAGALKLNSIESLFGNVNEQRKEIFQTLLYSLTLHQEEPTAAIEPALYFLRKINSPDFDHRIVFDKEPLCNALPLLDEFKSHLQTLLGKLFDRNQAFVQAEDTAACTYCAYNMICQRNTI